MQQTPPPPHLTTPPFYVERPPPVKSNYEYERSISLKEVSSGWDLKKERFHQTKCLGRKDSELKSRAAQAEGRGGFGLTDGKITVSSRWNFSPHARAPTLSLWLCRHSGLRGPPLLLPFLPLPPFTIPPPSHIQPQYRWSRLGEHFPHIFQIKYQAKMKGEQTHLEVTIFFPPFPSQPASHMGSLPQYR